MEKAIDIKRRAQRCIQNGDLDGALAEYEKLVGAPESDPYNYVLLADLLYKKGEQADAAERYLAAVNAYQAASLYKNAIAVCKKMVRLTLSPARVLHSLANLHALDGLAGEASLYFVQYAEHLVRADSPAEAAAALRQAFDVSQENIPVLEQLSEAWLLAGDHTQAAQALLEAARHYRHVGSEADAKRCEDRAASLDAGATLGSADGAAPAAAPAAPMAVPTLHVPEPAPAAPHPPIRSLLDAEDAGPPSTAGHMRMDGLESGRHHAASEPVNADAPAPAFRLQDQDSDAEAPAYETHGEVAAPAPLFEVPADPQDSRPPVYEMSVGDATGESPAYEIPDDDAAPGAAHDVPAADDGEESPAYEIPADDASEPLGTFTAPEGEEAGADVVYEIPEFEEEAQAANRPADVPRPVPAPDGVHEVEQADEPAVSATDAAAHAPRAHHGAGADEQALVHVEALLVRAQEQFRGGDRDEASMTLAQAAQVCETIGRLDNAASIYRSLGRGPHATPAMLEMWLANCERRGDAVEAAQVACELGDRALNDGEEVTARAWFGRSIAYDPGNETALRRIHRLERAGEAVSAAPDTPATPQPAAAPQPAAIRAPEPPPAEGRVEVAVGRAQAVSFDLAGLLAEFQRGVEAQLAGDAQSHYDLGMTYREMGLLDQAMESFRCAAQDPAFAARALEMVGRCLSDQGRLPEAVDEFRRALEVPGVTAENDGELRYYYGLALAGTGQAAEALAELEAAQERLPGFEDVDQHVADLRGQLGRAA